LSRYDVFFANTMWIIQAYRKDIYCSYCEKFVWKYKKWRAWRI